MQVIYIHLKVIENNKNDWGVSAKGGMYEPNSDILPNWRDMRSMFGYKLLSAIMEVIL